VQLSAGHSYEGAHARQADEKVTKKVRGAEIFFQAQSIRLVPFGPQLCIIDVHSTIRVHFTNVHHDPRLAYDGNDRTNHLEATQMQVRHFEDI
jgi:hypothetical protein